MTTISTNIAVLPSLILIWTVDFYLYLVVVRVIDTGLALLPANYSKAVADLSAGIPRHVERWLSAHRDLIGIDDVPKWLPWAIVVTAAFIIRLLASWIVTA